MGSSAQKDQELKASEVVTCDQNGLGHLTGINEDASSELLKSEVKTEEEESKPKELLPPDRIHTGNADHGNADRIHTLNGKVLNGKENQESKKHVRFKTKSGRADHLHTDKQKELTKLAQQLAALKRKEDRKEQAIRAEERGGIIHPPKKYPPGTVRKKPNKNGVHISKTGLQAKRECGLLVQEINFWKGERFQECLKRSAASFLPGRNFKTGKIINGEVEMVRSPGEANAIRAIRSQLLSDVTIDNAETACPGNQADDVSLTFSGILTRWTRDLDVSIGNHKFQLAIKATGLRRRLFWMLKAEPYSDKYSDIRYKHKLHNAKRKSFENFKKSILNWDLRLRCNMLFFDYVRNEQVRPIINVSVATANLWKKESVTLKSSDQLLNLFAKENENFSDFYRGHLKALFPRELKINYRTEQIFREKYQPGDRDWRCVDVLEELQKCQAQAKDEFNYGLDADHREYQRWYWKLRFDDLKLPRKFRPTGMKP